MIEVAQPVRCRGPAPRYGAWYRPRPLSRPSPDGWPGLGFHGPRRANGGRSHCHLRTTLPDRFRAWPLRRARRGSAAWAWGLAARPC